MTKVVFQDKVYWLSDQFWEEVEQSQVPALRATFRQGQLHLEPVTRATIDRAFSGKIAGWVTCEHKSVSVFQASLTPSNQQVVIQHYVAAISTALETVAASFVARTGAQGKSRQAAEPTFYLAVQVENKNGQPHLHAHIAVEDRVQVPNEAKSYATHKVQLYQLRPLLMATLRQEFGHRLQKEFGVRIQRTDQGLVLPDVPKALCEASSKRKEQIDQYLAQHKLPNTPLARKYGALATRRWNENPQIGRHDFERKREALGFRGEQITRRISVERTQQPEKVARSLSMLMGLLPQRVTAEARTECLLRVLEKAPLRFDVAVVRREVDQAIARSVQQSLSQAVQKFDQALSGWLAVIERAQSSMKAERFPVIPERPVPTPNASVQQQDPVPPITPQRKPSTASNASQAQPTDSQHTRSRTKGSQHDGMHKSKERAQSQSTEQSMRSQEQARKLLRQLWKSTRVVGAVGAAGIDFAKKTIELYQEISKPIWRLEGPGTRTQPGSLAHAVRDLKPQSRWESHLTAVRAMVRYNGNLDQKLAYGEHVYRQCRRPKFKIPKKSLVVIRDVESAHPGDVAFLRKKAKRAKARVLLVDREWSRTELVKAAKQAPAGQTTRINPSSLGC